MVKAAERQGESESAGSPWWRSGSAIAVCLGLGLPLALALFAGSLLGVATVYAVLFVEGDVLVYLIVGRARRSGLGDRLQPASREAGNSFVSANRVDSLTSLVRWASRGSDYSRREIAQSCARIVGRRVNPPSGIPSGLSTETTNALRSLVYPYRDDPLVKSELGTMVPMHEPPETSKTRRVRLWVDRGRYLSNLEAFVTNLEKEAEP